MTPDPVPGILTLNVTSMAGILTMGANGGGIFDPAIFDSAIFDTGDGMPWAGNVSLTLTGGGMPATLILTED